MYHSSDNWRKFNANNGEQAKKSKTSKKTNSYAFTEEDVTAFEQVQDTYFSHKVKGLWFEYRRNIEIDNALDTKDEALFHQLFSPNWRNVVAERFQNELKS